jgi:hypothetical protein
VTRLPSPETPDENEIKRGVPTTIAQPSYLDFVPDGYQPISIEYKSDTRQIVADGYTAPTSIEYQSDTRQIVADGVYGAISIEY